MKIRLVFLLLTIIMLTGCKRSEYAETVQLEMDKGVIKDSLIFNLRLGDSKQDFFDKCWQLNKEKKVQQGPKNSFAQYYLPVNESDSLKSKISMLFYGIFNDEKVMTGLDMKFYYEGWSIWNQSLQSDKLLPIIKDSLVSWFPGNEFFPVTMKKSKKQLLVKIDANRRIIIEPLVDSKEIDVRIDDLRFNKSLTR